MGRLDGRVALITGAGSGFGEGIARKFVAEGARVVIADINDEAGTRVADSVVVPLIGVQQNAPGGKDPDR